MTDGEITPNTLAKINNYNYSLYKNHRKIKKQSRMYFKLKQYSSSSADKDTCP